MSKQFRLDSKYPKNMSLMPEVLRLDGESLDIQLRFAESLLTEVCGAVVADRKAHMYIETALNYAIDCMRAYDNQKAPDHAPRVGYEY